jgi:glyoxylase-like metal-dependent hydrolase (beta-lactamase superfamily II)
VDGEAEALPGIVVWPMAGHTWGQQAIRFEDGAGTVCFAGDVLPTAAHLGPAYNMAYDMLPYTNMQSKAGLLRRAAAEGWRLVLDHEPGWPVVRVEDRGAEGFRLLEAGGPDGLAAALAP